MQYLLNLIVGLFRGWYAEYSRDKAHEDKGKTDAENKALQKNIGERDTADNARNNIDSTPDGLSNDPNRRT